MSCFYTHVQSPVGSLLLAGDGQSLSMLSFTLGPKARIPDPEWIADATPFGAVKAQLEAYFAGELMDFQIPLAPQGTPFQLEVWRQLREIPYGRTISYGQLAERLGNPNASRAVGLANGANPIAIIVPCHRVIGANGKLTGFGGGLDIKQQLLDLERGLQPLR